METEKEIFQYVRAGKLALPPLSFRLLGSQIKQAGVQADMLLETKWKNKRYKFVAEVKRYNSDRTVAEAANQARYCAQKLKANPLIIVPWLSNDQLTFLEKQRVSGLDLCGNGVLVAPEQLLIFRSGQPNKFPTSRLIRRVYEGTSSLVARVFLLKPEYASVVQILNEITRKGGNITLPTISKSLKQLEEDTVIWRDKKGLKLVQPDKLLDRLTTNYRKPQIASELSFKIESDFEQIPKQLFLAAKQAQVKLVLSGVTSVNEYTTMAREKQYILYCSQEPNVIVQKLKKPIEVNSRFPNVRLITTDDPTVYFDARVRNQTSLASPIQTYLELMSGDKREQETAQWIRKAIIAAIKK